MDHANSGKAALLASPDHDEKQQPSLEEEVDGIFAKSALILPPHSLAQVAPMPLPLTMDFQAGKIVSSEAPPVARTASEESYIPVALARTHLSRVVADMRAMKAEHAQRVEQIVSRYAEIEQQTREQFDEHVRALKKKARVRVHAEKLKIDELTAANSAMATQHKEDARSWQQQLEAQQLAHQQSREQWSEAVE